MNEEASAGNGVRIQDEQGKWTVIVTEDGAVSQRIFEVEKEASDFAVAERMRLGEPEPKTTDMA